MLQAIILMEVARGGVEQVAQALLQIAGVQEVYSTAGEYDLVAVLRVSSPERLNEVVNQEMAAVERITRTRTLTAFRCYSRDDMDRMFSVGL